MMLGNVNTRKLSRRELLNVVAAGSLASYVTSTLASPRSVTMSVAEFTREFLPGGVPAHCDDSFCTEMFGGKNGAKTDRAIADHYHCLTGGDFQRRLRTIRYRARLTQRAVRANATLAGCHDECLARWM
nr:hypothetical protein [uncultured Steroidobacter sp.]